MTRHHCLFLFTTLACSWLPISAEDTAVDWIKQLSADKLSIRVAAEKKLWQAGESARTALEDAAAGKDPEIAMRAMKVLRYMDLGITIDSPPEVVALVESFEKNSVEGKKHILDQLKQMRLYRTALLLFKKEKERYIQNQLQENIAGVAIIAAREQLLANNRDEAYRFLKDFPEDTRNIVALAWLAYAEGRLDEEIKKQNKSDDPFAWQYKMSLYRIKGDRQAASSLAEEQNLPSIAAVMELLDGNPEKWIRLRASKSESDYQDITEHYSTIALQQIRHKGLAADAMSQLVKISLKDSDYTRRWHALNALYAAGNYDAAAKSQKNINPVSVFDQNVDRERINDAIAVFGLDPEKPDYSKFINERMDQLIEDEDTDIVDEIPSLLRFLERRGLTESIENAFVPKMEELYEKNKDIFTELFENCMSEGDGDYKAPESAMLVANAIAKEDDVVWGSMIRMTFNENSHHSQWWTWLEKLSPNLTKADHFRQLLVLFRVIPDRKREQEGIETAIADFLKTCTPEELKDYQKLLATASAYTRSASLAKLASDDEKDLDINDLINLGQWELAAKRSIELAKSDPDQISIQLWAACCLYKAGKTAEAEEIEKRFHTLVLGDSSAMRAAAAIYQQMGFSDKAVDWYEKALHCGAFNNNWKLALYMNADNFMARGEWNKAMCYYEGFLAANVGVETSSAPLLVYRCREKANMARGFALYKTNREKALVILRQVHQSLLADASLADQFFPALRMVGATSEHQAWFEESWAAMMKIRDRFPKDDNIRNSAAWLAARAVLRLDDAEKEVTAALDLRPNQAAYLDTLGEIWFARKNREKALEWSKKAVLSDSNTAGTLREQYFRFADGAFP